MAWLRRDELERLPFRALGKDVCISTRCSLHGVEHVRIGDHVRIDDGVVITAQEEVTLGSYIHIGAQVFISGTSGFELGDFGNLSAGVAIFTATDDFSGAHLAGPLVPERFRRVECGPVRIGRHVIVGARSVVLPGVTIPDGVTVGCLSLVKRSLEPWTVYAGIPVRALRPRSRDLLSLEAELTAQVEA